MTDKIEGLCKCIEATMQDRLGIDSEHLVPGNRDKPLTGAPYWLTAVMMCHLIFEIEKKHSVRFDIRSMSDYGLSTVQRIAENLKKQKEKYHVS